MFIFQMSKVFKKPFYNEKALEKQWMNNIFQSHDLICGCDDPTLHLLIVLNKYGSAPKPEEDVKNIKCLITGDAGDGTAVEDPTPFEEGELEQLFAEDDGPSTAADTG